MLTIIHLLTLPLSLNGSGRRDEANVCFLNARSKLSGEDAVHARLGCLQEEMVDFREIFVLGNSAEAL
jgi:hypothetical protein